MKTTYSTEQAIVNPLEGSLKKGKAIKISNYYEEEILKLNKRICFLRRELETFLLSPFEKLEFKEHDFSLDWECDILHSRESVVITK